MLLVHEWQVLLIESPETEHERARSCSKIKTPFFGDNTYFIQITRHIEASLQRTESLNVSHIRAATS